MKRFAFSRLALCVLCGASISLLIPEFAFAGWFTQNSGTPWTLWSIHFPVDAQTGYVVGTHGNILKTTNGGANWVSQASGTTRALYSVSFPVDAQTGYIGVSGGAVLKTTDGGSNWVSHLTTSPYGFWGINFVDVQTGYGVGYRGTILKTSDGGASWVEEAKEVGGPLQGYLLLKAYPVPFNNRTLISYQIPSYSRINLTVYNITGQMVRILATGSRQAGTYQVYWDGTNNKGFPAPSGVYLIRLDSNSNHSIQTTVLLR